MKYLIIIFILECILIIIIYFHWINKYFLEYYYFVNYYNINTIGNGNYYIILFI